MSKVNDAQSIADRVKHIESNLVGAGDALGADLARELHLLAKIVGTMNSSELESTWRGRRISELSRLELEKALEQMAGLYATALDERSRRQT